MFKALCIRHFIQLSVISLAWLLTIPVTAQDSLEPSKNFMRDLPEVTLKTQFRIMVAEFNSIHLDEMKRLAKYSDRKCLFKTTHDELARQEAVEEISAAEEDTVVDFSVWDKPKYHAANAASEEDYLTSEEKKVFYYLNLMRMNPGLFAATYLHALKDSKDYYESTLIRELKRLSPKPILVPDRKLFESAKCHAVESGQNGSIGHERKRCAEHFVGECCHYGDADALEIVKNLLIDKGVESLGHRRICMMDFNRLGVSIQPHKTFKANAVLDFGYSSDENRLPTKKK